MRSADLPDRTSKAEAALARLRALGLAPTPENYAIWYAHACGEPEDLVRTLDILVSNGQEFTDELARQIYAKYFLSVRDDAVARDISVRAETAVMQLQVLLGEAETDMSRYGAALDDFATGISTAETLRQVRDLVTTMATESQRMVAINRRMEAELDAASRELSHLRKTLEEVRREAMTDPLTGVANRKGFDLELRRSATQAMEDGKPLSLLLIDIDHFKKFNDAYGHQVGDLVLRQVAGLLRENVKGRDVVARYGGEEFVILLPMTSLESAVTVGDQIRRAVASNTAVRRISGDDGDTVTLSVGATCFEPGEPLANVVRRADVALYEAKRQGRNQVVSLTDVALRASESQGKGRQP